MSAFPKEPRVVPIRHGLDGYDLYLDSPLGYVPQGRFDTKLEVAEELERLCDGDPERTPSLW